MKKLGKVMIAAAVCTLWGSITAFAGEWKSDANGRWYVKDDGNYVVSDWLADNGKMYYFNADGYMVSNTWVGNYYVGNDGAMLTNTTTPDGYYVGMDGAWVEGGQPEVQDNQYLEAYAAFLRSYKIPKRASEKPRFHLLYIDGDAIPELLISEGGWRAASGELYHYYQGEVQKLGYFGECGGFSYIPQANIFYASLLSSGIYTAAYYMIQDNDCITLIRFDSVAIGGYFAINDFSVTKEEFNNQQAIWEVNYPMVSEAGYFYGHDLNETNIKKMLENIQNVMSKQ